MSAYAATARIERVSPRLVIGRAGDDDVVPRASPAANLDEPVAELAAAVGDDPFAERLAAARERWTQLTFYLFDAQSWR